MSIGRYWKKIFIEIVNNIEDNIDPTIFTINFVMLRTMIKSFSRHPITFQLKNHSDGRKGKWGGGGFEGKTGGSSRRILGAAVATGFAFFFCTDTYTGQEAQPPLFFNMFFIS